MHEFTSDRGNERRFELLITHLSLEFHQVFILEEKCMPNSCHIALQRE